LSVFSLTSFKALVKWALLFGEGVLCDASLFHQSKKHKHKNTISKQNTIKNTVMKNTAIINKAEVSKKIMLFVSIVTCVVLAVNF